MRDPLTIDSGSLRIPVEIQASSVGGFGQAATWATVLSTRASIRSLSLSEKSTAAGFSSSQVTHRIVMRYQSGVPLRAGMRILAPSGTYDIQAVDNVQERNRVVVVLALETGTYSMIEAAISDLLNTSAPLTSLIAGRIYPIILPETPTLPAVTLQRISSQIPMYTLDGALGAASTRLQINVFGDDLQNVSNTEQAIRVVLESYRGTLSNGVVVSSLTITNSQTMFESDARLYYTMTDYLIVHSS